MVNLYKLLDVQPSASKRDIQSSYRRLSKLFHPDVSDLPKAEANQRMVELNAAWETLQNPVSRLEHDEVLRAHEQSQSERSPRPPRENSSEPPPVGVPPMVQSNSKAISSFGYDASQNKLYVKFRAGGLYVYFGVPANVYQALTVAESRGRFVLRFIVSGGYRYERIGN